MANRDRLDGFDFAAHNEEVRLMWEAFHERRPTRVPVVLGTNTRYFMFNPEANPEGLQFEAFSNNPDLMFDTLLQFQRWSKFNLLQDYELGLPEQWNIWVDFQNYYEAAWFGCAIHYMDDQVPDTHPDFEDNPLRLLDKGLPDPFSGLFAKGLEYYEHMKARAKEGYWDRPVNVGIPGGGTDGPLTVACNLFGAENVCAMFYEDPDLLHQIFDFLTTATIARMAAWRKVAGIAEGPQDGFGVADDSIALISTETYREHVLPYHRRIYDAFGTSKGRSIHLCGDSTRHFPTLVKELSIQAFDTGFPVNFGQLRKELGPDVLIQGGPHVDLVLSGTPEAVTTESKRILESGILEGGRFILREGNNLAPHTPLANTEAMVQAGRAYGRFPALLA